MAVGYGAPVRSLLPLLAACGSTAATAVDATPDSPPIETHALSMNDVSILLPLPVDPATPVMMSLNGIAEPLVPSTLFLSLVTLAMVAPKVPSPIGFGDFQVVALRFDLCDRSTVGVCPAGVDGRLRLILQPTYTSGGVTLANDLAVHTFFPIPAADLPAVVNELRALARIQDASADAPLGVSPAAAAGNPEYLQRLTALVTRYASADTLVRATSIGQEADSEAFAWIFGGFDRQGADFVSLQIPGIDTIPFGDARGQKAQLTGGDVVYNIDPVVDDPPGFMTAINGVAFGAASAEQRLAAVEALLAIQNPLLHDAVDTQCVACHVSTNLLPLRLGEVGLDPTTLAGYFQTSYNTTVSSIEDTDPRVVRGFGWAASLPAISQRVANDTAEVLTEIEHRFPVP